MRGIHTALRRSGRDGDLHLVLLPLADEPGEPRVVGRELRGPLPDDVGDDLSDRVPPAVEVDGVQVRDHADERGRALVDAALEGQVEDLDALEPVPVPGEDDHAGLDLVVGTVGIARGALVHRFLSSELTNPIVLGA